MTSIDSTTKEQFGLPWEIALKEKEEQEKHRYKRRANDLDGSTRERYSISIWSDIRKSSEEISLHHPALFPVKLVDRLIRCYTTREDRLIFDPFAGVGSTIVAAHRLGKTGLGIEIELNYIDKALKRLDMMLEKTGSTIYCDDARNLKKYISDESVDMIITSPPYWDILLEKRTADSKPVRHFGKIPDYKDFLVELQKIFNLVSQKPLKK